MSAQHGSVGTAAAAHHHRDAGAENAKLALWVYMASDLIMFASLLATYLALYGRSPSGPSPAEVLSLPNAIASAYAMLAACVAMTLGGHAIRQGNVGAMRGWLGAAALLGLAFLGLQAADYGRMAAAGVHLNTNLFSASYYALSGLHWGHVAVGVGWLAAVVVNSFRGRYSARNAASVETAGVYWQLLFLLNLAIFTFVYLMEFMD